MPNVMVVSSDVDAMLKQHPAIIDRIKYTSGQAITDDVIARFFEIDDYLVSGAVVRTGRERSPNKKTDYMMKNRAGLFYRPASPSLLTPSAGYNFSWSGYTGMVGGIRISSFRMEHIKSDRFEAEMAYAQQQIGADLGYFFNNPLGL